MKSQLKNEIQIKSNLQEKQLEMTEGRRRSTEQGDDVCGGSRLFELLRRSIEVNWFLSRSLSLYLSRSRNFFSHLQIHSLVVWREYEWRRDEDEERTMLEGWSELRKGERREEEGVSEVGERRREEGGHWGCKLKGLCIFSTHHKVYVAPVSHFGYFFQHDRKRPVVYRKHIFVNVDTPLFVNVLSFFFFFLSAAKVTRKCRHFMENAS